MKGMIEKFPELLGLSLDKQIQNNLKVSLLNARCLPKITGRSATLLVLAADKASTSWPAQRLHIA